MSNTQSASAKEMFCDGMSWLELNAPGGFYLVTLIGFAAGISSLYVLWTKRKQSQETAAPAQNSFFSLSPRGKKIVETLGLIFGIAAGLASTIIAGYKYFRGKVFIETGVCVGAVRYEARFEAIGTGDPTQGYDFGDKQITRTHFERDIQYPTLVPAIPLPRQFYEVQFSPGCEEDMPRTSAARILSMPKLEKWVDATPLKPLIPDTHTGPCNSSQNRTYCMQIDRPEVAPGTRVRLTYDIQNAALPNACWGNDATKVPFDTPGVFELRYTLPKRYWFDATITFPFNNEAQCDVLMEWTDRRGRQWPNIATWIADAKTVDQDGYQQAWSPNSADPGLFELPVQDRCSWSFKSARPATRNLTVSITFRVNSKYLRLIDDSKVPRCLDIPAEERASCIKR